MMNEPKEQVSLRVDKLQVEYLRYLARYQSIGNPVDISYTELIRSAIEEKYPVPNHFTSGTLNMSMAKDFFNDK